MTVNLHHNGGSRADFGDGVKATFEYLEQHATDPSHIHESDMTITGPIVKPADQ
jgi:hypothetical protein